MPKKIDSHPPHKPAVILKELREHVGMTQPRLAELTGFSRDDIANFERVGTGAGSVILIEDALKCYEALATEDKTGNATSAALSAATWLVDSIKDTVEEAKKTVEFLQGRLKKHMADEKRIKALKRKRFPHHKADERFLVQPFPKKLAHPLPGKPGSLLNPLRGK